MSKWDKLITRICNLSKDLRFDELRKVLEMLRVRNECTKKWKQSLHVQKAGMCAYHNTKT